MRKMLKTIAEYSFYVFALKGLLEVLQETYFAFTTWGAWEYNHFLVVIAALGASLCMFLIGRWFADLKDNQP